MRTTTWLLTLAGVCLLLIGAWQGATARGVVSAETAALTAAIPTTPNDFFLPGTQPNDLPHELVGADTCYSCHANYSAFTTQPQETETWYAWSGSMMAQSARDPLFYAALDLANADAEGTGEWCLRCHTPRAWYAGRSTPADGTGLVSADMDGVQCSVCHRMVDPTNPPGSPAPDAAIIAAVDPPMETLGSGALILDPEDRRRGPRAVSPPHGFLQSDYLKEAYLCASCHDINNPLLTWDEVLGEYTLNDLDTPAGDQSLLFPIERTYSEWLNSDYADPVDPVTCQGCHMQPVEGQAAIGGGSYSDMALHDLTGANTWVPLMILDHPEFGAAFTGSPQNELRRDALLTGIERARAMLESAATLSGYTNGRHLTVTVFNETGHKLPTGYPEGRRVWLQVEGYDLFGNLVYTSGAYDAGTGVLTYDDDIKVYEIKQGITDNLAAAAGVPAGPSFHFALNNMIIKDNRIPPRGFTNAGYAAVRAEHYEDGAATELYADGQYWDETSYHLPNNVAGGVVRLLYQTSSKEYIDFLVANDPYADTTPPYGSTSRAQLLQDLWAATGRSAPEVMAEISFTVTVPPGELCETYSCLYLPMVESK